MLRLCAATPGARRLLRAAQGWPLRAVFQQSRGYHRPIGIVGMPNVGKSTLFNALTKSQVAQAANYPFCTIEPNVARVPVPDPRLHVLAEIEKSKRVVETQLEFVDIAGLVRGAHKGEGLGNQFLSNIRQVAVVLHVIRCFEDPNIIHVETTVDPLRDLETIRSELVLADLQTVESRLTNLAKKARSGDKDAVQLREALQLLSSSLGEGIPANAIDVPEDLRKDVSSLQLLSAKPVLYVCNVKEEEAADGNAFCQLVKEEAERTGSDCLVVSAGLEEAAAGFDDEESQMEYLECFNLKETGLTKVMRESKRLLHLQSFYTVGETEARAWDIRIGSRAPEAAGVIHSDFERYFIRAETISYDDFVKHGGEKKSKEAGAMRSEGKDYIVQDGDVMHFLFNK